MRSVRVIVCTVGVAAAASVGGCSYRTMLEKLAPKDEVEFARARLNELRAGRFDQLETHLDSATSNAGTRAELERMMQFFPAAEPRSVELIGSNVASRPGWWTANLSFQYEFPDNWLVASVVLHRKDGSDLAVKSMHLQRIPDSLQHINEFTFAGKGPRHYLVLGAALLIALFTIASFIVCVRTAGIRRKWLWAIITAVGVPGVILNWTTGAVGFQLGSIHLFGASAGAASPYSPWFVTASFPLGAVLFLVKRARLRSAAQGNAAPVVEPGAT